MEKTVKKSSAVVRKLTITAMFATAATLLMYWEFPLPFMPPFLKMDLSGVPTLLCAFMFGPVPAILVTLVKNLVHLLSTTSGGVGGLADFIMLSSYALTASLIYSRKKDRKHALIGCCAAIGVMSVMGVFANMFLLIPFYSKIMPIEVIVNVCAKINPLIGDIRAYYVFGVIPFNLIKGIILAIITIWCYKRLSNIVKKYD